MVNSFVLSVPLTYQLLCSDEQQLLHGDYQEVSGGSITPGMPAGCGTAPPSLTPVDPVDKTLKHFQNTCPISEAVFRKGVAGSSTFEHHCMSSIQNRSFMVGFAQKRFSLILALTKVILWLPMMIQMVVQHITGFQSLSFEMLSFLLTLLAATVTPLFVMSEHWIHLPCGCIINCGRNSYAMSSEGFKTKRRGFEFNLSFQQGYGIYRISHKNHHHHHSEDGQSTSCHNLVSDDSNNSKEPGSRSTDLPHCGTAAFSILALAECSQDVQPGPVARQESSKEGGTNLLLPDKWGTLDREEGRNTEQSTFFEGPERRLSQEESRKPELTDWEWCRSKSERTSRQRSGGALAVPLCAFQGTVSLQAPTGKTLSLSTYERAVVRMDERREERIVQLLSTVQTKNEKEQEAMSWWSGDEEGPTPEQPPKVKVEAEKAPVRQRPVLEKTSLDRDVEYLFEKNEQDTNLDEQLQEDLRKKKSDPRYIEMQRFREKLPSYGMRQELVNLINNNRVTVISGETGCGKTTQVTQFILDDYIERGKGSTCRIVCTQPRRISAISVAERVAAERAEACGNGKSTGYQIRLQSRLPRKQGSILYCTTGIVLQWLQSDKNLSSISHVVLDEIHERNLQSDVLMSIIKDLLNIRLDLKVILMSATLNAEKFSEYFDNCPMIHIPGFTFPVVEYLLEDVIEKLRYTPENTDRRPRWKKGFMQGHVSRPEKEEKEEIYRERWPGYLRQLRGRYSASTIDALEMMDDDKVDLDLIAALIRHIVLEEEDGAILVFLPGWDNISTLHDLLMSQVMFKSDRFIIIPLHSLMPTVNQTQVFKKTPPGVRKIVIATNIAETSITIDDVVFVIDGGKIKETHFDTQNNISTMAAEWVSKANAKQRKGRAGRVQPGHCYHLYNGLRASLLDDYQLPEILRTPLEELCLQIKILKLGGIAYFLSKLMDPPSRDAVTLAINHLMELNALDRQEKLTPLGVHLARLPVEPHIGKMILFGALFCCLDPVLTIAASLSFKDPFVIPLGKEKVADARRKELSKNTKSDHLTVVNAFMGWEETRRRGFRTEKDYCWEYFLSSNTLQMLHNMKGQFAEHLLAAGFVNSKDPKDPKSNTNSDNEKLLKAVICAGLYPKVAKIRPSFSKKRKMVKVCTKTDGTVNIHPKSVNVEETEFHYNWLVYHLKMRTSSIYLYDCTEVSPYCLLFFGGDISIQKDKDQDTIAVDEWIVFQSPEKIAHLVKNLRQELDDLLQEKIENPHPVDWNDIKSRDTAVLTAIIDLITTQENESARNYAPRFQSEHYS